MAELRANAGTIGTKITATKEIALIHLWERKPLNKGDNAHTKGLVLEGFVVRGILQSLNHSVNIGHLGSVLGVHISETMHLSMVLDVSLGMKPYL